MTRPAMRRDDVLKVLAIDDEADDLRRLQVLAAEASNPRCLLFTAGGFDQRCFDALRQGPHLVLLDDQLAGGMRGEQAIATLRRVGYGGPIAILSGLRRQSRSGDLVRAGAMFYLSKDDLNLTTFMELIDMAMAQGMLMRYRRAANA